MLTLVCCNKKSTDNTTTAAPTKAQLVGIYLQTGKYDNGVDVWTPQPQCMKDNPTEFRLNGSYVHTDQGIVCSGNETYSGTWDVNGSTFTMDGIDYQIQSFNGGTLTLRYYDQVHTKIVTYAKQ